MRKKSLFYKRILCGQCGSNYKSKREKSGRVIYICSNYDNYGKCKRLPILENKIVELITNRYQRELSENEIREEVVKIIVHNELHFDIIMAEGNPISFHERGIIF